MAYQGLIGMVAHVRYCHRCLSEQACPIADALVAAAPSELIGQAIYSHVTHAYRDDPGWPDEHKAKGVGGKL